MTSGFVLGGWLIVCGLFFALSAMSAAVARWNGAALVSFALMLVFWVGAFVWLFVEIMTLLMVTL